MRIKVKSVNNAPVATVRLQICRESDDRGVRTAETENKLFSFFKELVETLPIENSEIDEDGYCKLEAAAEVTSAVKKGLTVLSFGSNSEAMLVLKLRRRGVKREYAEQAAAYLKKHGYINESGDAEREVERCLRKHWGLIRILAHLKSKGYDEQTVTVAEEMLSNEDFSAHCAKLISLNYSELPIDIKEKRKMISSLVRYGYTMSEIENAIDLVKRNAV